MKASSIRKMPMHVQKSRFLHFRFLDFSISTVQNAHSVILQNLKICPGKTPRAHTVLCQICKKFLGPVTG
jgi:hypothetical protein